MSDRPVGPTSSAYRRGANYAEIYLADSAHRAPEEVEALRAALAAQNTAELHIPTIFACFADSGHPDHPGAVDPADDFWHGFVDHLTRAERATVRGGAEPR